MQKAVEIIVGKKLERPPLNTCCRYYRLYLPEEIAIDTNQCKDINLNFEIKLPDNVATILFQTHYSINSRWRLLVNLYNRYKANRYKEIIIKLFNKTEYFSFKFPNNTEIARLYLFTTPTEKNYTIYKQNQ